MLSIQPDVYYLSICLIWGFSLYEAAIDPPSISFGAGYSTFIIGEQVMLQCNAPANSLIHGYQFFKNNEELKSPGAQSGNQYRIRNVNMGNQGIYTCNYWLKNRENQHSAPSGPVTLTVMDQPSMPSLRINPENVLYLEGESVNLLCEHSGTSFSAVYTFYKDNKVLKSHNNGQSSKHTFTYLTVGDSGTYACQYYLSGDKRMSPSARSPSHTISVKALSSPPFLNFVPPYSVFIVGEEFTIVCEAPSPIVAPLFRFYKDEQELRDLSTMQSGKLTVQNITKASQGNYICMYWATNSLRAIPSTQSITRELNVLDPLLPPFISMDPPNGRIWDGGNVTLFCTAPIHYKNTTFHFLHEKQEIQRISSNRTQTSMTITVTKWSNVTSTNKYSCQYTAEIGGRKLLSPECNQVEIIVIAGSVLWLITVAVAAGITVLIIIIFLLYWIMLARKDITLSGPEVQQSSEDGDKLTSPGLQDKC
ncbi:T-cell-interacting, activating receptor on myeloid cells protein 1 [Bombina bombina]|uniref:T-cell-interacting, activating receptor on myeloid cells protein 1 n=1 Tax=Bombina bombina TaxID=8345 RepID=UPI00235A6ADE|nr:T-cell-interacting, activating receptor on myeloid cells protein 1 [Bombina bombina]